MTFPGVDYWAIFIAAVIGNIAGAIWYWAFSKPWMDANGLTEEAIRKEGTGLATLLPYVYAFVAQLIMAAVLAGIISHLGKPITLRNGVISGAMCWLGFIATSMVVNNTFARRRAYLFLIDGGYWLLVLVVMGGIIGGLGVKL